ncbi:MAG: hypothetical protein WBV73_28800 [Phormidium sp.]
MIEKVSKLLVIDASVARAAGGESAKSPTSKYCRDFLLAVLDISHRVVMTPDIRKEWDKHQSSFARTWLRTIVWVNPAKSEEQALFWLESGALAEGERHLGFYVK